jgi:hypothetical protein
LSAAVQGPAAKAGQDKAGQDPVAATDPRAVHFETKVRPLLIRRCEECHAETADGNLRVDSREALLKGGDSGPAIVVGDPEASLLIQAVRQTHKLKMPKKRSKLGTEEVAALEQWIKDGAVWPAAKPVDAGELARRIAEQKNFWSFRPLEVQAVPAVASGQWPRTDIDRFVLARLEQAGLQPSAPAERRTWIRRATFDLIGLPPTAEEVAAFVADAAPDAVDKVLDRLLTSTQYGEHWARWWLDIARYGEDDCRSLDPMGRGFNPYPYAYLYRDWVISALADDMPYAQFVTAQLAADLLPEPERVPKLPALGFLGLGPWYYDNGSVEVTRADERNDRVDAVSRGFLGLTVACARCHDHKYDPIAAADYYALAGVFLNTRYREYPQAPKAVVDDWQAKEKRLENKQKLLGEFLKAESKQTSQTLALQAARYMTAAWQVLGPNKLDKAMVASDEKLDYELFDRWLAFLQKPPKHYPYLRSWQVMIAAQGSKQDAQKLADEFQATLLDVMFAMKEVEEENDIIRAKALPGTKKKERAKLPSDFVTNDDFCPGCGLELKNLDKEPGNLWTDVFLRDLDAESDAAAGDPETRFKPALLAFRGYGLERQLGADRRAYIDALKKDIGALKKALGPKYPYVHGCEDVAAPVPIKIHLRGSPFKLGDEVPRRFLAVLQPGEPQPFLRGSGRLELAQTIAASPLTARVLVNRVWKQHFGTGLVDTASNFGVMGERPSHPELLEHLAKWFVDHGGSLKELHREIMRSAVYLQGASDNPVAVQKDEADRLYWRASERRLSAEQLRDALLAVGGSLDDKHFGPSSKLTLANKRRTVYGRISRYSLDPFLALFDFPSPNMTSERRFTTNVAPQRLFLMNSDFIQQQAELTAARLAATEDDRGRIDKLYQLLFQREPTVGEVAAGLAFLQQEPLRQYEEHKAAKAADKPAEAKVESKPGSVVVAAAKPSEDGADKDKDKDDDGGDDDKADESPGMMAGLQGQADADKTKKPLPVTVFGRYVKVLLSSNEFLFLR